MRALSISFLVVCVGCGGAEFTSIDPHASRPELDAGLEVARQDAAAVDVAEDAGAPLEGDAAAVDVARELDAGLDAPTVDAPLEQDAAEDHHVVMTTCTATQCPACPELEMQCCNTQTLACGCFGVGVVCH